MKFEYDIRFYPAINEVNGKEFKDLLNDYGQKGWELVCLTPQKAGYSSRTHSCQELAAPEAFLVKHNILVFKRATDE